MGQDGGRMKQAEELLTRWMKSPLPKMANVIRFSSFEFHHRESVAEHTFFVMFLAWVLARHIEEVGLDDYKCAVDSNIKRPVPPEIDYQTLLEKGLFHDVDESITGDIIRPFKYSSVDLKKELELSSLMVVESEYGGMPGGGPGVMLGWQSAKDETLEGRLIDFADVWSVWLYLRREVDMGNRVAERKIQLVAKRVENADWHHLIKPYARAMALLMRRGA
jgi:5'-deoxynucleotidase YfbR-like HD superfamily hydrolase